MSRQVDHSVKLPGFASFLSLADACILRRQILSRSRSDDCSFEAAKHRVAHKPPTVECSTPTDLFGAPNDANRKRRWPWESDWGSRSETDQRSGACLDADVTPGCKGEDLVTPAAMTSRLDDDVTPLSRDAEICNRETGLAVPERTGEVLPTMTSPRSPLTLPRPDRAGGDLTSLKTEERYVAPTMTSRQPSLPLPDLSCGRRNCPLLSATARDDQSRTAVPPPAFFVGLAASPYGSMRHHLPSCSSLLDVHKSRQRCDEHQHSAGCCCRGSPSGAVDNRTAAEGRNSVLLRSLLDLSVPCSKNDQTNSPLLPSMSPRFQQPGQTRVHSPAYKTPLASVEAGDFCKHVSSPRHSAVFDRLQRRLDQCRLHFGDRADNTFAPIIVPTTATGHDVTSLQRICPATATGRDVTSPLRICPATATGHDVTSPLRICPATATARDVTSPDCMCPGTPTPRTSCRCEKGQGEGPSLQPGPSPRYSRSILGGSPVVRDTHDRQTVTCSPSQLSLGSRPGSNLGPNPSVSSDSFGPGPGPYLNSACAPPAIAAAPSPSRSNVVDNAVCVPPSARFHSKPPASPISVPSVCLKTVPGRGPQSSVAGCSPASSLLRTQGLSTGAAASPRAYCHSRQDRENKGLPVAPSPVSLKDCPKDMGKTEHGQRHHAGSTRSVAVGPHEVALRATRPVTTSQELGKSPRDSVSRSVARLNPTSNRPKQPANLDRATYSPFQPGAAEVPCGVSSPMRREETSTEPSSAGERSHDVSFDPTGEFSMHLMAGFAYGLAYAKSLEQMTDPANQLVPSVGGQPAPVRSVTHAVKPLDVVHPRCPASLPDPQHADYRRSRVMRYIREVRPKIVQSEKTIRYLSRSTIARTRSRVGGRFAKESPTPAGSQETEHRPL